MNRWIVLLATMCSLQAVTDRSIEQEIEVEGAKHAYSKVIASSLEEKFGLKMVPRVWPLVDPEIRLVYFESETSSPIETKDEARTLLVRAVSVVVDYLNQTKPDPIVPSLSDQPYIPEGVNFTIDFTWPKSWWRYFSRCKGMELSGVSLWHGEVEYTFLDGREPMRETYQEARSKVANYVPW